MKSKVLTKLNLLHDPMNHFPLFMQISARFAYLKAIPKNFLDLTHWIIYILSKHSFWGNKSLQITFNPQCALKHSNLSIFLQTHLFFSQRVKNVSRPPPMQANRYSLALSKLVITRNLESTRWWCGYLGRMVSWRPEARILAWKWSFSQTRRPTHVHPSTSST